MSGPAQAEPTGLRSLARGSLRTVVGSLASSALGFLLVVIVTRGLHAGGAGVLFEVIALFTILTSVADLGADTGMVRFLARYRVLHRSADLRRTAAVALVPVVAVGAVFGAGLIGAAGLLARALFQPQHRQLGATLIRAFAPFLPFATGMVVAMAGTRGMGTMKPFVRVQNVGVPALRVVAMALVVGVGSGAVALGLAWGIPVVLGFAAGLLSLSVLVERDERTAPAGGPAKPVPDLAREFWRFSGPRGVAALITVALGWFDVLLVGALRSAPEAGIYAAVSRFIGVGTFALQATAFAIAPQISALLARDRRADASSLFQTATAWVVVASWPVYLAMATFAPVILRVFGREFAAGQDALTILALAMLVYVGVGNNKTVLLMSGRSGWNIAITGAWLAVSLVLDVLLIPRFGIEGAAVAYAVAMVGENLTTTVVVQRLARVAPVGPIYVPAALAAVGCYGVLGVVARLVLGASLPAFVLFGVVATALYVAVLWRLRERFALGVLRRAFRPRGGRSRSTDRTPAAEDPAGLDVRASALEARAAELAHELAEVKARTHRKGELAARLTDELRRTERPDA